MYRDAVLVLTDTIPGDIEWAVTASTNLRLRGIPVDQDDVAVMTPESGVHRIADVLSDHITRPVRLLEEMAGERIRFHFGALELVGTVVELMDAVEHRVDGDWVQAANVAANREFLTVDGRDVPAMPLEHELRGYRELGHPERAALVEAHLQ